MPVKGHSQNEVPFKLRSNTSSYKLIFALNDKFLGCSNCLRTKEAHLIWYKCNKYYLAAAVEFKISSRMGH